MRLNAPVSLALLAGPEIPLRVPFQSGNDGDLPLVTPDALRALITTDHLLGGSQVLEDLAYSTPERNRVFASPAHNATVNFLYDTLAAYGNYYSVSYQPFLALYLGGNASLTVGGANQDARLMAFTPPVKHLIHRSWSQAAGQALVDAIAGGAEVLGNLIVNSILQWRTTYNVIAQTRGGNQDNVLVLGGHSDSVEAGPGINDNGCGSIAILDVAIALTSFSVNNAVRFCWWSAEESMLQGSFHYVSSLEPVELAKIRLYLNFDMIASPNYIYGIYDGDGSRCGRPGPSGSAEIEALFEQYFAEEGLNYTATRFGNSDNIAFTSSNIPAGGVFTGASRIKTEEEFAAFGGQAGVAYDKNYHGPGDNVTNLNMGAFQVNTEAIAYAVATYATSFDSLPPRDVPVEKRWDPEEENLRSRRTGRINGRDVVER
ncbi:Leucyl aminopeptidase yscIV [Coniosporium tulheliwenetii]|uniref:Leucyl aminopeptidase yscIV n=1 Tax=Coniosporium tulheliwenetii TaxID=3383036 RepID=A0ACC2YI67_9PEZI|nr:Leucyl aminopeptidase yscIV [Cladosporium sp. JES 115]